MVGVVPMEATSVDITFQETLGQPLNIPHHLPYLVQLTKESNLQKRAKGREAWWFGTEHVDIMLHVDLLWFKTAKFIPDMPTFIP